MKHIPIEIYKSFSFAKGAYPDYERLTSYFVDNGLFINNKGASPLVFTVQKYVEFIKSNISKGNILSISEKEISSELHTFGKVAQIASKYELTYESSSGVFTRYGVNLFQLIDFGADWKVSSMCWDDRTDKSLL